MEMPHHGRRVLAIGAHPDDVEIMCGGLMLELQTLGCELHMASLTLGDCGSIDQGADDIRRIRRGEAQAAAALMGASYHSAGFNDFTIFVDDPSTRRVTALLRDVDPFLVITHPPHDYLADHEATSRLVRSACFIAPAPNYSTEAVSLLSRTSRIPYLYYAHPIEGVDVFGKPVTPQFYVDVDLVFDEKLRALACHESQRSWLRAHHGVDEYLEAVRRWSLELGRRASTIARRRVPYAEAYRQHRGHAYPRDNVLAELLDARVIDEPDWHQASERE